MIKVAERAPEFELEAFADGDFRNVSLNEYKGKWVVLFFWPLDFTFICPTEIRSFNELYDDFRKLNSEVLGASVDSVYSHKAWVEDGLGLQGAQAEYVRVPNADATLVGIPEGIKEKHALLTGDILSTGYFCADNAEIKPGGLYAVIGCGPVGMLSIMSAFEQGAQHIVAIDMVTERLEMANRMGAVAWHLEKNPILYVMEKTHGIGAEAVMEAVGSPGAQDLAMKLVRPGGIISTVGVHTSHEFSFSPVEAYNINLCFKTGRCPARYYMDILLPKLEDWKWDLDMIFSHELALEEGPRAYEIFDRKEENALKILLKP